MNTKTRKISKKEEYHRLLLSELRWVTYIPATKVCLKKKSTAVSNVQLQKAVTANEIISTLGYTLMPGDIVRLAGSPSLNAFPDGFRKLLPSVNAEPMYPDFPKQVMEMPEAVLRFHQAVHYFSTYGIEQMTGDKVEKGWIPDVKSTEKTETDNHLLGLRVIELVPESEAPLRTIQVLCGRRQRLQEAQKVLVSLALDKVDRMQLRKVTVSFKENLYELFSIAFSMLNSEKSLALLRSLCMHTGDVLKCTRKILSMEKYHLHTRQKKRLVHLLETYPVEDFRRNLVHSARDREKNLIVLQYLDYNRFSRSAAHRMAVNELRNGKLKSWESVAREKIASHSEDALPFVAKRPGMFLRWTRWLLKLGYSEEEIREAYRGREKDLSLQTLVSVMEKVGDVDFALEEIQDEKTRCLGDAESTFYKMDFLTDCTKNTLLNCNYKSWLAQRNVRLCRELANLKARIESSVEGVEKEKNRWSVQDYMRNYRYAYNSDADPAEKERINQLRKKTDSLERTMKISAESLELYKTHVGKIRSQLWFYAKKRNQAYQVLHEKPEYYKKRIHARKEAIPFDQGTMTICRQLFSAYCLDMQTPLRHKKVYMDMSEFDLAKMRIQVNDRRSEGGYLPEGTVFRIPDQAKRVRFFVYWNDKRRVDIDLHTLAHTTDGQLIHVGWNGEYNNSGIVYSGDITHSDAAEYIDIDLDRNIREVRTEIILFSGAGTLSDVETCYVGMMAVDKMDRNVNLYDPANCFFVHEIHMPVRAMVYGYVDVQNRCVRFCGQAENSYGRLGTVTDNWKAISANPVFTLSEYLRILLAAQQAEITTNREEAEIILTMGKSVDPRAVSLADNNFFLDC